MANLKIDHVIFLIFLDFHSKQRKTLDKGAIIYVENFKQFLCIFDEMSEFCYEY